ncbi:hypothetical protein EXIGLDRAFT_111713 [Exidia glandulosa HHB12029]|uniref:Uncharacterized protein n=1 Tax=Exidia glandulosa HHB12029 TaxID=1314781 RepID=A0A165NL29_EXIGL|nr:hypothetical protein EXIGLDRAFT_111713 [Exidia glandulosa HHB12029]
MAAALSTGPPSELLNSTSQTNIKRRPARSLLLLRSKMDERKTQQRQRWTSIGQRTGLTKPGPSDNNLTRCETARSVCAPSPPATSVVSRVHPGWCKRRRLSRLITNECSRHDARMQKGQRSPSEHWPRPLCLTDAGSPPAIRPASSTKQERKTTRIPRPPSEFLSRERFLSRPASPSRCAHLPAPTRRTARSRPGTPARRRVRTWQAGSARLRHNLDLQRAHGPAGALRTSTCARCARGLASPLFLMSTLALSLRGVLGQRGVSETARLSRCLRRVRLLRSSSHRQSTSSSGLASRYRRLWYPRHDDIDRTAAYNQACTREEHWSLCSEELGGV